MKNEKVGAEPRYSSLPAERARDDRPGAGDLEQETWAGGLGRTETGPGRELAGLVSRQ